MLHLTVGFQDGRGARATFAPSFFGHNVSSVHSEGIDAFKLGTYLPVSIRIQGTGVLLARSGGGQGLGGAVAAAGGRCR